MGNGSTWTDTDEARELAALTALPGLTWRPFDRDDLRAVGDFYALCEEHDDNPERQSLDGLREFWDSPRSRPDEDTLAAYDESGAVVATAWSGCNRAITERRGVHLGGAVHPERRGQGIGTAVLRWEIAHALRWDRDTRKDGYGPLVMRLPAPTHQRDVRDLAQRHGLEVARYFFEMSRPLRQLPEIGELLGVRLESWDPARSSEVHRAIDTAFADHWGHVDRTAQMWAEYVGSAAFRPDWSLIAVDAGTGGVVGAALNCAYQQDWRATGVKEGYTDMLGVLRSYRGRGVARALLAASMRRFEEAGISAAALGVDADNPTGALGLYEGLGYVQAAGTCVHEAVWSPASE